MICRLKCAFITHLKLQKIVLLHCLAGHLLDTWGHTGFTFLTRVGYIYGTRHVSHACQIRGTHIFLISMRLTHGYEVCGGLGRILFLRRYIICSFIANHKRSTCQLVKALRRHQRTTCLCLFHQVQRPINPCLSWRTRYTP